MMILSLFKRSPLPLPASNKSGSSLTVPPEPPQKYEAVLKQKSEFHRNVSTLQLNVARSLGRVRYLERRLSWLPKAPPADGVRRFHARVVTFMHDADCVSRQLAELVAAASQPVDGPNALASTGRSADVARLDVHVTTLQLHAANLVLAFAELDPVGEHFSLY